MPELVDLDQEVRDLIVQCESFAEAHGDILTMWDLTTIAAFVEFLEGL